MLLDGNRAATLVANSDSFFTSVDLSNLNFGTHTLGVEEVLISGDTLFSEESVFVLTEISEKIYYEGLPTAKEDHQHNYYFEEGLRFKCNLRLPSSNGWSYVNNSGESLIVKAFLPSTTAKRFQTKKSNLHPNFQFPKMRVWA